MSQNSWMHQSPSVTPTGANQSVLDQDQVLAFMRQLCILPAEEADFGWIAELGLQSPLPTGWEACTDPNTGYTYYANSTGASSWENPLVPALQRVVGIGRQYLQNKYEGFFEDARNLLW